MTFECNETRHWTAIASESPLVQDSHISGMRREDHLTVGIRGPLVIGQVRASSCECSLHIHCFVAGSAGSCRWPGGSVRSTGRFGSAGRRASACLFLDGLPAPALGGLAVGTIWQVGRTFECGNRLPALSPRTYGGWSSRCACSPRANSPNGGAKLRPIWTSAV
jgi:hypothetical protein